MPGLAAKNGKSSRIRIHLQFIPGITHASVTRTLKHGRSLHLGIANCHVVNTCERGDSVLVTWMLTSRAVYHRPANQRSSPDRIDDGLPQFLDRSLRPREKVLSRLPPSHVERTHLPSTIALHTAEDDLCESGAQLWTHPVNDEGLEAATFQELPEVCGGRNGGHPEKFIVLV